MNEYKNYDEIEKLIKKSPIIGFDDYPFKKIFKNHPDYLNLLVSSITGIDFSNEHFVISDTTFKSGLNLKGTICDLFVKVNNMSYEYGIDIESQQYAYQEEVYYDRALTSACNIYLNLHPKGEAYNNQKRAIVIYLFNNKYKLKEMNEARPMTISKFIDYVDKDKIIKTRDNITIYSVNVNSVIKNGFETKISNDKIIVEMFKVLSASKLQKYLNSKMEVISTMAKEIKYINEQERVNAMALSLAEVKENFDKTMPYVYGRADGLAEGRNETLTSNINSMHEAGLDSKEISRLLKMDSKDVEKYMK